jgi:hypothetical protein
MRKPAKKAAKAGKTDEKVTTSKPFTIRKVSEATLTNFNLVAKDMEKLTGKVPTNPEVFEEMAERAALNGVTANTAPPPFDIEEFINVLGPYYKKELGALENIKELIENCKADILKVNNAYNESKAADLAIFEAERATFKETLEDLGAQLEEIKKKAVFLSEEKPEFICCLSPEVGEAARKARPFIYKDGRIKNPDKNEYPNELANIAVEFYLITKYESVVLK